MAIPSNHLRPPFNLRKNRSGQGTSAVGAKELSPALQRWVSDVSRNLSAVGTAEPAASRICPVPTGLGFITHAYPALKRWAKIFRPSGGTISLASRVSPLHGKLAGLYLWPPHSLPLIPECRGFSLLANFESTAVFFRLVLRKNRAGEWRKAKSE